MSYTYMYRSKNAINMNFKNPGFTSKKHGCVGEKIIFYIKKHGNSEHVTIKKSP